MARPKRFELLTPRFVVWCSIQLSYGRRGRWAVTPAGRGISYRLDPALASRPAPSGQNPRVANGMRVRRAIFPIKAGDQPAALMRTVRPDLVPARADITAARRTAVPVRRRAAAS